MRVWMKPCPSCDEQRVYVSMTSDEADVWVREVPHGVFHVRMHARVRKLLGLPENKGKATA